MIPVILFTYNRSQILPRTLACLKNNKIDLLYIFSDGPKDAADEKKVAEVRKLLDQIDWVKTEKFYQEKNLGLSASVIFGVNQVLEKYEAVICVEDDVCVAPDFYEYMKACLEKYQDDQKIAGVTGIRFPFPKKIINNYANDVALLPHFSSWGWGTWRRFWNKVDFDRQKLLEKIKNNGTKKILAQGEMKMMVKWLTEGEISGGWDVYCGINMLLDKQLFVWPSWNMVENSGLWEGTHAKKNSVNWGLVWEEKRSSGADQLIFPKTETEQKEVKKALLKFLRKSRTSNRKLNRIISILKNKLLPGRGQKK